MFFIINRCYFIYMRTMSKKTIINHFKIIFYIAYHLVAYTFHDVRSLNVIRYPKILPHLVWSFDPFGRGFVIYKNRWHRDTKRQSTATSHLSRIWKHVCGYCSESLFILIYTLVCMHARLTFYDKRVNEHKSTSAKRHTTILFAMFNLCQLVTIFIFVLAIKMLNSIILGDNK